MMQQLQQLKEKRSLHITKEMSGYWANTGRTQDLNPMKYLRGGLESKKVFAVASKNAEGKVIGYADKGDMYITPYDPEVIQLLRNAGYKEYSFFIPLAPPEMSLIDKKLDQYWRNLVAQVAEEISSRRRSNRSAVAAAC